MSELKLSKIFWIIRIKLVFNLNVHMVSLQPPCLLIGGRNELIWLCISFHFKCSLYNVQVDLSGRNMWIWIDPYLPFEAMLVIPILIAQINFSQEFKLGSMDKCWQPWDTIFHKIQPLVSKYGHMHCQKL